MKILFLTNAYPDFDSSYRGVFVQKMARLLHKDGYEITVVTPKIYKKSRSIENLDGINVYRFPFFAGNKLLIEYERIPYLRMILYYLSGTILTFYVLLRHRCKLIHAHWAIPTGLIALLGGTLFKKPVIVTIHGSDLRMALEKKGGVRRIFVSVCQGADHIQCVSEEQKKEILILGLPETKISVIPMGIDDAFCESGVYRKIKKDKRPFTVLSNRNLLPIYNVSQLIRAIPMVLKEEPEIRFLIAGEGSEKEVLERIAKGLNVNSHVDFLGRIPHEEMPNLLSEADIFVSTSLYDGTSVSLLEAMASGCFPVVTDIPANREWIKDGENGFLVPVDKEGILAEKIIEAIQNQKLLEESRKINQSIVAEKALWPVCIEKTKEIYGEQLRKENVG